MSAFRPRVDIVARFALIVSEVLGGTGNDTFVVDNGGDVVWRRRMSASATFETSKPIRRRYLNPIGFMR